MSVDTAAKRASAVNVSSPWRGILPFPDGTIDQGDRQTVPFLYSGILAGGAAPPDAATIPYFQGLTRNVGKIGLR